VYSLDSHCSGSNTVVSVTLKRGMPTWERIYGACALVLFFVLLFLVRTIDTAPRAQDERSQRFELQHDENGRAVRLDKVTGDAAVIGGNSSRGTDVHQPVEQHSRRRATPPAKQDPVMDISTPAPAPLTLGDRVRVGEPKPIFLPQNERLTPLRFVDHDLELMFIRPEGTWSFVRFNDERFGERFGYLKTSAVRQISRPATQMRDATTPPRVEDLNSDADRRSNET